MLHALFRSWRLVLNLYGRCSLLVQPEHLPELGDVLIETQRWLNDNSRDILDESDEIPSVRFERN